MNSASDKDETEQFLADEVMGTPKVNKGRLAAAGVIGTLAFAAFGAAFLMLGTRGQGSAVLDSSGETQVIMLGVNPGEIPLAGVLFNGNKRLSVQASPEGEELQFLTLDTGSSDLVFCDKSLAEETYQTTSITCEAYGQPNSKGYYNEGYWGFAYKGPINVEGLDTLASVNYSVMQDEVTICNKNITGIFGIAFAQLAGYSAFNESLMSSWTGAIADGEAGPCPHTFDGSLTPPLIQTIDEGEDNGKVGIYWSGEMGHSVGMLYIGQSAVQNQYYSAGNQVQATLGENGYYEVNIKKISVGGTTLTAEQGDWVCNPPYESCIMDTGTPILQIPKKVFNKMFENQNDDVAFELASGQSTVSIKFPITKLIENNMVFGYEGSGPIILGLPLWSFYYTVFDIKGLTVSFVPL